MGVELGQRVSVPSKDVGNGTVAFIGETQFAKGIWIGIVLDEKRGKNNGSIQNIKYFECQENFGMFVREQLIAPEQPTQKAAVAATPSKSGFEVATTIRNPCLAFY